MSLSGAKDFRLLHKKDGTYVLQALIEHYTLDAEGNHDVYFRWEDVETVEEEDEKNVD